MKTPMQEILEWVRATLPMDLDTSRMIEEKIEAMLEKEKEAMCEFAEQFAIECINFHHEKTMSQEQFFNLTFNTKEK